MAVSDTLREAIEACGMSRYRIAQETGVNESTLSRFVSSGKGLSMDNCDRLCEFLGLELTAKVKRRRAAKER